MHCQGALFAAWLMALVAIVATEHAATTSDLVWEGDTKDRTVATAAIENRLFLLEAPNGTSQILVLEAGPNGEGNYSHTSTLTAPVDGEELCANPSRSHLLLLDRANSAIWLHDLQAGEGTILAVGPTYKGPDAQQQHILHDQPVHIACHEDAHSCSVYVTTAKAALRLTYPCLSQEPNAAELSSSGQTHPPRRALKDDSLSTDSADAGNDGDAGDAGVRSTSVPPSPFLSEASGEEEEATAGLSATSTIPGFLGLSSRITWSTGHSGHAIWSEAIGDRLYLMLSSEGPNTDVAVYDTGSEASKELSRFSVPGKSQMMCAFPSSQHLAFVDRANSSIWLQDLTTGKGATIACQPGVTTCSDEALPQQPGDIACLEGPSGECVLFVSEPSTHSLRKLTFPCSQQGSSGLSSWWASWWVGFVAAVAASLGIAVAAHVYRTFYVRAEGGLQELREAQTASSRAARAAGYQGIPASDPQARSVGGRPNPAEAGYSALPKRLSALADTDSLSGTPLLRDGDAPERDEFARTP